VEKINPKENVVYVERVLVSEELVDVEKIVVKEIQVFLCLCRGCVCVCVCVCVSVCVYVCVIAWLIGCGCVEVVGWGGGILYICTHVKVYLR